MEVGIRAHLCLPVAQPGPASCLSEGQRRYLEKHLQSGPLASRRVWGRPPSVRCQRRGSAAHSRLRPSALERIRILRPSERPVPAVQAAPGHQVVGLDEFAVGARTGLDLEELWLRYVALGGNADPMEVDGYLHGLVLLTPGEHNVLACAVNERLDELGDGHVRVPYCWRGEFGDPTARGEHTPRGVAVSRGR